MNLRKPKAVETHKGLSKFEIFSTNLSKEQEEKRREAFGESVQPET